MSESEGLSAFTALLFTVALAICSISGYLAKRHAITWLPESSIAILCGLVVGGLSRATYDAEHLEFLRFHPSVFFFVLLPPIIFEAGYSLEKRRFFQNFWTIFLFAGPGTALSTCTVAALVYLVSSLIPGLEGSNPIEALIFGSLISASDPVGTLSILGSDEMQCDPLLYSLIFGESVLNDAVAIVLFKTFLSNYNSIDELTATTIPTLVASFFEVTLGSIIIGTTTGLSCCYICKNTGIRNYPTNEITLVFLFAYGAYALSEAASFSGIMALFISGIVLSH